MKKLFFIGFSFLSFLSCKKESQEPFGKSEATTVTTAVKSTEDLGKEIFENKGNCIACHLPDKKLIGPSLHDIAKIYKDKNADMVTFLKGDGEPLVDPSQFEVMKTNFAITEEMSDEELQALEAYIYSNLK